MFLDCVLLSKILDNLKIIQRNSYNHTFKKFGNMSVVKYSNPLIELSLFHYDDVIKRFNI